MLNPTKGSPENGNRHLAFLNRAAHDPEFRAALEADPEAVCADYGLSVGSDGIPSIVALPSPESILDILIEAEETEEDNRVDRIIWHGFLG